MIHMAVCEDDDLDYQLLDSALRQYIREKGVRLDVTRYTSAEAFFAADIHRYQLLFMDVMLPGTNGYHAVEKLRQDGVEIPVVFVSNMEEYAVKGYDVNALYFMVKPINYYDFAMRFDRILSRIPREEQQVLRLEVKGTKHMLPIREIRYIEIIRHNLIYYTADGQIEVRGSISQLEEELSHSPIVRCHKSYLVNLRHVRTIDKHDVILESTQERLPIGDAYRKPFLKAVMEV